ncbi:MAG TPA: hypothetical protein VK524_09240 [Polyangiaceae bacterium]|nr:hypothetical protein [Polyangiaceae bacterium]
MLALASSACVPTESKGSADAGGNRPERPPNVRSEPRRNLPSRLGGERSPGPELPGTRHAQQIIPASDSGPAAEPAAARTTAPPLPRLREAFTDTFERPELGTNWSTTSPAWRIDAGRLCVQNARNHPVWLRAKIPVNARIEFEAISSSANGDIKAEFWGDGKSSATSVSYTNASSYLTIFGGWKNQYHVLARIDEHAKDRPEIRIDPSASDLRGRPVRPHQTYHFKVERTDGKTVRWFVDDIEILSLPDPNPLKGPGHEHFGFNNWEVPLCFDNLKITPLGE